MGAFNQKLSLGIAVFSWRKFNVVIAKSIGIWLAIDHKWVVLLINGNSLTAAGEQDCYGAKSAVLNDGKYRLSALMYRLLVNDGC